MSGRSTRTYPKFPSARAPGRPHRRALARGQHARRAAAPAEPYASCGPASAAARRLPRQTRLPAGLCSTPPQFGVEGTGGPPSPETLALLGNPKVVFDTIGVADLQAGRIDPRIVAVLTKVAETHAITVNAMCSDDPKFTAGGAVPRCTSWAAAWTLPRSTAFRSTPATRPPTPSRSGLGSLDAEPPDEVGSPFPIAAPGYYTDAATQDHLHIAFKQPIDPSGRHRPLSIARRDFGASVSGG